MRRAVTGAAALIGLGAAAAAQSPGQEGFVIDMPGDELRDQLQMWNVSDLAVGDSAYVHGEMFCERGGRLYLAGNSPTRDSSVYVADYRIDVLPGRKVELTISPPDKYRSSLAPEDLRVFAVMRDCAALENLGAGDFLEVDRVNGVRALSELLNAGEAPGPSDAAGRATEGPSDDPEPEDASPTWSVREERSKIDDSRNVFLSLPSREKALSGMRFERRTLMVRCSENTTSLYVIVGDYLGSDDVEVTVRVDDMPAKTATMPVSTTGRTFGFWRGATAIPFIKGLFGAENLLFRVTPYGAAPVTLEFAVAGLEEAIRPLREACHW